MDREKLKYSLVCAISFLLLPVSAYANMVWPSLYIAEGMRSWYVIVISLLIETVFVKCFLKETYFKSAAIAFVMNLVSTVLGAIMIPASGFIGEFLMVPFGTGTFHPSHWVMSYLFAVVSNVLIEGFTIKGIFKYKFKTMFCWLFVANSISVIICILFHGFAMQKISI